MISWGETVSVVVVKYNVLDTKGGGLGWEIFWKFGYLPFLA